MIKELTIVFGFFFTIFITVYLYNSVKLPNMTPPELEIAFFYIPLIGYGIFVLSIMGEEKDKNGNKTNLKN